MGVGLIVFLINISWAAEMDILLNKLVEKGIFTKEEAQSVKQEVKQEAAKEIAVNQPTKSIDLPEWVGKTKLKGDMRVRYQYEKRQANAEARTRARLRYRLGIENEIAKDIKVGAGLATGGADPRSTNQTFQDSFQHPDIRLDYAFGEYVLNQSVRMVVGKFKFSDYLWTPDDFLWDTDINPEGGSIHFEHKLISSVTGYVNSGVWVIDDNGTTDKSDPYLTYAQSGFKWNNDKIDVNLAGIFYGFNGIKGTGPDWCSATNTGLTAINSSTGACTGTLVYDYDSVGASLEVGMNKPIHLPIERIAFFGDYIQNIDPIQENRGWAAGLKFGNKKIVEKGQWQGKYQYSILGQDAFVDFTPDSDRLGGATDITGHEIELQYAINKNVILALDYYHDQRYRAAKNSNDLVQGDVNFKF